MRKIAFKKYAPPQENTVEWTLKSFSEIPLSFSNKKVWLHSTENLVFGDACCQVLKNVGSVWQCFVIWNGGFLSKDTTDCGDLRNGHLQRWYTLTPRVQKKRFLRLFNTMVFKIDLNAMWPYLYTTVYGAATAKNRCQEVVLQIFLRNIGEMNREL